MAGTLVLAMAAPSAATAAATTVIVGSTGAAQDSPLGPGVMSATFKAEGAQGSGSPSSLGGGLGGSATAPLDLPFGQPVKIFVGTSGGFNGGGASSDGRVGGGGTDVRIGTTDLRDRELVAGGGGGGGNCTSPTSTTAHGGAGGGLSGGDGGFGFPSNPGGPFFCTGGPGGGGTQTSGGSAPSGAGVGFFGQGGAAEPTNGGGGGGGGWFGGGGGAEGGGGGGTGNGPPGTTYGTGVRSGSGQVTITYMALDVTHSGTGAGYVDSTPTGIDCGHNVTGRTICSGGTAASRTVTLKAHPADGTDFTGFSANCTPVAGRSDECTVTMDDAKSVSAAFVLEPKELSVVTHGSGSGFVDSTPAGVDCGQNTAGHGDCAEDYADSTPVTLTAHPDANTDFTGFDGAGCSGTATTCTVTLDQARNVSAGFVLKQRALDVTTAGTGDGTVDSSPAGIDCGTDCADSYADGTSVTLTAHPAANNDFTGWSGGSCSGTATTCTLTMDQARSVTATFTVRQRALSVTTDGTGAGFVSSAPAGIDCGGAGHADCAESYAHGTKVTLIAHPDASSDFTGFTGAGCAGSGTTCEVTMDQARAVNAGFAAKPPPQTQTQQTPQTPAGPGETTTPPKAPKIVVSHRRPLLRNGKTLIELRCKGVEGQTCEGTIVLRSTSSSSRSRTAGSGKRVRFSIRAEKRKTLALSLPHDSKLRLARTHKAVAVAVIALSNGSSREVRVTLASD